MPFSQVRNANFGKSKAGLSGSIGYTLFNQTGNVFQSRTTFGIYEIVTGSGIYAANISFDDAFRNGTIIWDTGEISSSVVFVSDQFNTEENDPNVITTLGVLTGSLSTATTNIQFLVDMEGGRWKIDSATNRMQFYKSDNSTLVAQFDLYDINGASTIDQVTERRRV